MYNNKPIILFWHNACVGDWKQILRIQYDKLHRSGLLQAADRIVLNTVGTDGDGCLLIPDTEDPKTYLPESLRYDKKLEFRFIKSRHGLEYDTLRLLWEASQDRDAFLGYIHVKGVLSANGNRETPAWWWREYMEYFIIENWELCLNQLNKYDTVGVEYRREPAIHYSGNFWWTKSSYVNQLNSPTFNRDRVQAEMWIGSGNPKMQTLHNYNQDLYRYSTAEGNYKTYQKVLILLPYYNQPDLLRKALLSIKDSTYHNWHLAFVDDGSSTPGKPIVEDVLKDYLHRVSFYRCDDTADQKTVQGGSRSGFYLNRAVSDNPADIAIFLCHDDRLLPDYLENLVKWFQDHPESPYVYSFIKCEIADGYEPDWYQNDEFYNKPGPLMPACAVDASQVAWRVKAQIDHNCWFVYPATRDIDADFYQKMQLVHGECPFSGFYGQVKGIGHHQLGNKSKEQEFV